MTVACAGPEKAWSMRIVVVMGSVRGDAQRAAEEIEQRAFRLVAKLGGDGVPIRPGDEGAELLADEAAHGSFRSSRPIRSVGSVVIPRTACGNT